MAVLIVADLSLKNLQPRVWDVSSPFHLRNLRAVMVSYADFHRMPAPLTTWVVGIRSFIVDSQHVHVRLQLEAQRLLARLGWR